MLTIKAEVRKDRLRSDLKYNIKVRFTLDRQVKRLSTSLFATADDLTKSLDLKEGTAIKQLADELVLSYQKKCAELKVDLNNYTVDGVIDLLNIEEKKTAYRLKRLSSHTTICKPRISVQQKRSS